MLSFADVVKTGAGYVMCLLTEEWPMEGYIRRIAQAQSPDGIHWTVAAKDVAELKTEDGNKGTYGLSLAADPADGTLQVWLAAGDGLGTLALKYARTE